ncbi:MAG: hypothetical protein ACHQFW_06045 [Chitinophagales bacterium]
MHSFIEIFSIFIITIISFIAPISFYLLSISTKAIVLIKKNAETKTNQIYKILSERLRHPEDFNPKQLEENSKLLNEVIDRSNKTIKSLNTRLQISRIFTILLSSLLLMFAVMFINDHELNLYDPYLSIFLIAGSVVLLVIGLFFLQRLVWIIIYIKTMIAENELSIEVGSQDELEQESSY